MVALEDDTVLVGLPVDGHALALVGRPAGRAGHPLVRLALLLVSYAVGRLVLGVERAVRADVRDLGEDVVARGSWGRGKPLLLLLLLPVEGRALRGGAVHQQAEGEQDVVQHLSRSCGEDVRFWVRSVGDIIHEMCQ